MPLIPFAYSNAQKNLVDVSEVPRGLACNCVCPSCNMRLQARQGDINEHHFSHYDKAETECIYSYWVSMRDMSKQILTKAKYIKVKSYNSSNLQTIPYKLNSQVVKIFKTLKKYNEFDLVLYTSIGELNIYFSTPEENRFDKKYIEDCSFKKLVLEINLSKMIYNSSFSKKEQLQKLIIEDINSKQLICPSFTFKDEDENKDFIFSEYFKKNDELKSTAIVAQVKNRPSMFEEITKCLYLDMRSLNYRQKNAIEKMEEFYYTCSEKHFEVLFSDGYTICHKENGFEYISYENKFYALADVDGIYVVYRFDNSFFVNVLSTRTHKNIYFRLQEIHNEARAVFY